MLFTIRCILTIMSTVRIFFDCVFAWVKHTILGEQLSVCSLVKYLVILYDYMLLMIVLNIIWADSYSIIHCHGNTISWTPTGNRRRWRSKETRKDKVIVSTLIDGVVSCRYGQNTDGLQSCPHEEADTRMLLHIKDAMNGFKSVMIRAVDTYVVVLPVTHFQGFPKHWATLDSIRNL